MGRCRSRPERFQAVKPESITALDIPFSSDNLEVRRGSRLRRATTHSPVCRARFYYPRLKIPETPVPPTPPLKEPLAEPRHPPEEVPAEASPAVGHLDEPASEGLVAKVKGLSQEFVARYRERVRQRKLQALKAQGALTFSLSVPVLRARSFQKRP